MLWFVAATLLTSEADPGSRLLPSEGDGPALVEIPFTGTSEGDDRGVGVGLRTRFAFVPPALLDSLFANHTEMNSWSVGAEVSIDGPGRSRVIFGLDYTRLWLPAGNFRLEDSAFTQLEDPEDADYVEVDLHAVTLDVLFAWEVPITTDFGFTWALGLAATWVPGTIETREVLPTCTEPVERCAHWKVATAETHESPWPVYPLLEAQVGLFWDPSPLWRIRADVGFRGTMYAGVVTELRVQ